MAIWEWVRAGEIQKQLEVRNSARVGDAYGDVDVYDQVKPHRSETFKGKGFTWAEVQTLINKANTPADAAASAGLATIVDHLGGSWVGPIENLKWDPVADGGSTYWELSLTLFRPTGP